MVYVLCERTRHHLSFAVDPQKRTRPSHQKLDKEGGKKGKRRKKKEPDIMIPVAVMKNQNLKIHGIP